MKKNIIISILGTLLGVLIALIIIGFISESNDIKKEINLMKQNFVQGCTEDGGATYMFCSCAYDKLIEKYGKDGFETIVENYGITGQLPDEVWVSTLSCI